MSHEASFGVVPLQKQKGEWHVLLINHTRGGFWAFPKGHAEEGELPKETAQRELFEETGLSVVGFLTERTFHEDYQFYRGKELIRKKVVFFLAEVQGELNLQQGEVFASKWVKLSSAEQSITFNESKAICREVAKMLLETS